MTPDPADFQQGERTVGQYVLTEKIGQGGMAEVWKARHRVLGTYVAIKFLIAGYASVPDIEKRFLDEGKRQAQLSHPNIVSAYDFLYEDGRSYLIMKLVEGQSLENRLYNLQGPMSLAEILPISGDVLRALDYAHSHQVIHRDIKPSNILIDHEGRAFVMDFGIALVLGQQRATRVGVAVGTPHFMSPEQIMGARVLDPRTDIYSYGCVLYEMLTGQLPFDVLEGQSGTDFVIQNMHLNQAPTPPRQLNPAIPEHIEKAVLRCLEKKAADRFDSCQDLLKALLSSPPPTPVLQPRRQGTIVEGAVVETPRGGTVLEQQAVQHDLQREAQRDLQKDAREFVRQPDTAQPAKSWNLVAMISGALLVLLIVGGGVYWYTHRPTETKEGKVSVQCNVACDWTLDGKAQDKLQANQPTVLTLSFGDHQISASTADNKSHKDVSFNVSSSTETLSENIELKPSSAGPEPKVGEVSVQCNVDCNWMLDGQSQGQMAANQPSQVQLPFGPHQVSASTTDGKVSRSVSFKVSSANQTLAETIDLKSETTPPPAQATLAGNWSGKYKNENTGLESKIRLTLRDNTDTLSGSMTFDPGGRFQSSCTVNGVYDAHKLSMFLQVGGCRGSAPNYLADKLIFESVHRSDRDARGMNSTQTAWLEIKR